MKISCGPIVKKIQKGRFSGFWDQLFQSFWKTTLFFWIIFPSLIFLRNPLTSCKFSEKSSEPHEHRRQTNNIAVKEHALKNWGMFIFTGDCEQCPINNIPRNVYILQNWYSNCFTLTFESFLTQNFSMRSYRFNWRSLIGFIEHLYDKIRWTRESIEKKFREKREQICPELIYTIYEIIPYNNNI